MTEADIPAPVLFYLAAVIAFKIRVDVRALRQAEVRPQTVLHPGAAEIVLRRIP